MNKLKFLFFAVVFLATLLVGVAGAAASRIALGLLKAGESNGRTIPESAATFGEFPQLAPLVTAQPNDDFDPTGAYDFEEGTLPKAFADIQYINIETREYLNEGETFINRPIVPKGSINAKTDFNFAKIAVNGREIALETEAIDGISYKFVGRFPLIPEG